MTNTRKILATVAFSLFVLAFFGLLAYGLANRSSATGRSGLTQVGKPAPEFSMPLLGGGEFRLSEHGGQPLIINFWASWCPPCREESPIFERTWQGYRDQGIYFVGVNIQDAEEDAEAYVREFGLSFANGRDVDGKISVDYGVIGLPVTFFVGADGVIEGRWVGAISEERLVGWSEALLAGSTPERLE